jgi:hypothetical protein
VQDAGIVRFQIGIFERFKDGDVHAADKSVPTFANREKQWKKAGKVKDGPNQYLAPLSS